MFEYMTAKDAGKLKDDRIINGRYISKITKTTKITKILVIRELIRIIKKRRGEII